MIYAQDIAQWAIAQSGKPYVFGAEAAPTNLDPKALDCSELVEWSCARAGVQPTVPDGAVNQYSHVQHHGLLIPVKQAAVTKMSLLFSGPGFAHGAKGRDAIHHVAFSLGNGTTIEARGHAWGVGTWQIGTRFTFAGLIPGVDYTTPRAPLPAPPSEEDLMGVIVQPQGQPDLWLVSSDGMLRESVTEHHAAQLVFVGRARWGPESKPEVWPVDLVAGIRRVDGGK